MKVKEKDGNRKESCDEDDYQNAEKQAFANLFEYIRTNVIPNKNIVSVTSLTSKLESFMLSGRVKHTVCDSTRKHIRRRLVSELENSVHIFPVDGP